MNKKVLILSLSLFFFIHHSFAQNETDSILPAMVDTLNQMFTELSIQKSDSQKFHTNKRIIEYFNEIFEFEESFNVSFDSIKNLGKLKSPDNLFRIYNWNIVTSNNIYYYFGFIQLYNGKKEMYSVYQLIDLSENIINPEFVSLDYKNWYGCLYYEILKNEHKDKTYYTLIGWDGNNSISKKKIIDILRFSTSGKPLFGASVFEFGSKKKKRIIFEYSAKANMSLRFDPKSEMIIFDHLAPSNPKYTGVYSFYGPDFSYDALEFVKGKWTLSEDIDVRNPKTSKDKKIEPKQLQINHN